MDVFLKRRDILKGAAALARRRAGMVPRAAFAADEKYPVKPIQLVVPFPPGGIASSTAQVLADGLQEHLGQIVNVINKPGAGGMTGVAEVARAKPDGYTIVSTGTDGISVTPAVKQSMPYDSIKDFTFMGSMVETNLTLVVHAKSRYQTIADLFNYSKENDYSLKFGTFGLGSSAHVIAEKIARDNGAKITAVPYQGSAPTIQALAGGFLDFTVSASSGVRPFRDSGDVRVLAALDKNRVWQMPDVPTYEEITGIDLGLEGLQTGYLGPAGVPQYVVDILSDTIGKIAADPKYQERIKAAGLTMRYLSAADFRQKSIDDLAFFTQIAKSANISIP